MQQQFRSFQVNLFRPIQFDAYFKIEGDMKRLEFDFSFNEFSFSNVPIFR